MSRLDCRRSPARFASVDHGWSQRASHRRGTKLEERSRKVCEMSLVEAQMSGGRNVAGFCQCRFQHREESTPGGQIRYIDARNVICGRTRIAAWRDLAISLSCSSLGLLPRISGSQKVPTAPFMCPILPCAGAGALTHCDGSRPTPHTMYAWVNVFGLLAPCLTFKVEGSGCVILE